MLAQHVDGYDDKWLINLEYNPWIPRISVYRINGIAQTYNTEEEANAVIAQLQAQGEQATLNHYAAPVAPLPAPTEPPGEPRKVTARGKK